MKREVTFRDKVRVLINFFKWVKRKEDAGLVAVCSCCGSTRVSRLNSETNEKETTVEYKAMYRCVSCNSVATCHEVWHKSEEGK